MLHWRLFLPALIVPAQISLADMAYNMAEIHCEAIGGMSRLADINSLRATGITYIGDKALNVVIIAQKPNRVRTEILADGRRIVMAYDGSNPPWQYDVAQSATKISPMDDAAAREFVADSEFLDPLVTRETRGFTLQSLGQTGSERSRFQCLLAKRQGEEPLELWLDPNTYLINRQFRTRKLANKLEAKIETRYSDFRPVRGILMPFRIAVYAEGRRLHETVLDTVEPNPDLRGGTFEAP